MHHAYARQAARSAIQDVESRRSPSKRMRRLQVKGAFFIPRATVEAATVHCTCASMRTVIRWTEENLHHPIGPLDPLAPHCDERNGCCAWWCRISVNGASSKETPPP